LWQRLSVAILPTALEGSSMLVEIHRRVVSKVNVKHSCGHWQVWPLLGPRLVVSPYLKVLQKLPCPSCLAASSAMTQAREALAELEAARGMTA
jgi:hypothetical protein